MNIVEYIGKFHPLAVHLPIGVLSVFIVLVIFIQRPQLSKAYNIIKLVLLVSALAATGSSISGYLLAEYGSYDIELVTDHQFLGFALTIANWLVFFKFKFLLKCKIVIYRTVMGILLILMIFTGHAGGSLTHGSDFLSPPSFDQWFTNASSVPTITMQSNASEVASLIFQQKCNVCHGKNKQKGSLRLDGKSHILKGGEGGELLGEQSTNSLLIDRILLPTDDEDHMPPAEKKQLSDKEIEFLVWWVDNGANFDNSLSELSFPDTLHSILSTNNSKSVNNLIPEIEVENADDKSLERLRTLDAIVIPVGTNSNYLSANFVNVLPENLKEAVKECTNLKNQLIWLNLDFQNLDKELWVLVGEFNMLRKLSVKESNIDNEDLTNFSSLSQLAYLNLVGNNVTSLGIKSLQHLQNLESLFLYQTGLTATDYKSILQLFPNTTVDTGNYVVPTFESDTTVYTKQ